MAKSKCKYCGRKLVYPIGTVLCKDILTNTGIDVLKIIDNAEDVNGAPIYVVKHLGWYDGTHLDEETHGYFTTEYGLADYSVLSKKNITTALLKKAVDKVKRELGQRRG